jgi:hypothetical protein
VLFITLYTQPQTRVKFFLRSAPFLSSTLLFSIGRAIRCCRRPPSSSIGSWFDRHLASQILCSSLRRRAVQLQLVGPPPLSRGIERRRWSSFSAPPPAVVFSLDVAVACELRIRRRLWSSSPPLQSSSSSSIRRCSVSCVTGSICFFDRIGSCAGSFSSDHAVTSARLTLLLQALVCSSVLDFLISKKEEERESYCSCLLLAALGDSSLPFYIATQRAVGY